MLRQDRKDWATKAMTTITIVASTIVCAMMLYAIYTCNKLTPEERKAQGYKEWTYVERN